MARHRTHPNRDGGPALAGGRLVRALLVLFACTGCDLLDSRARLNDEGGGGGGGFSATLTVRLVDPTGEHPVELLIGGEPAEWISREVVDRRSWASLGAAAEETWDVEAGAWAPDGQRVTAQLDMLELIRGTCDLLPSADGPAVRAEVDCLAHALLTESPLAAAGLLGGCSTACVGASGVQVVLGE